MGKLLIKNFSYANWPNYLHKIIEHVQEILEHPNGPGSTGAFNREGNEGGNKLFCLFWKNYATKGDSDHTLEDVIQIHWLYSSKRPEDLASVNH